MVEQQRNQHTTQAAVAVEIGVDGLELDMHQRDTQQRRQIVLGVNVALEFAKQVGEWISLNA
jgi:hypothetical protein